MKKVISLAVALVLCLSIFAGCGAKEVNLADLMDKMNSEYSVDATKYETKDDMYKYYNINADDIKWHHGLIANPNCPTISSSLPLRSVSLIQTAKIQR